MTILVGKKWDKNSFYIGRGSPLGNLFKMRDQSTEERNRVCDLYEQWFYTQLEQENMEIISELDKIYELSLKGDVILGCYCSPKRCHGDTIKNFIEGLHLNKDEL